MNAFIRFRLGLTEDNPTIKPYDEKAWCELPDTRHLPVEVSLQLLDALHERWVHLLQQRAAVQLPAIDLSSGERADDARRAGEPVRVARAASHGSRDGAAPTAGLELMTRARRVRAASLAAVVALSGACRGGERAPAADSSVTALPSPPAPRRRRRARRSPACERTGHWIPCQVRQRLERSGLAPRDSSASDQPALGPAPTVFRVGKGSLVVYLFADSATRARAATTSRHRDVRGGGAAAHDAVAGDGDPERQPARAAVQQERAAAGARVGRADGGAAAAVSEWVSW